MHALRGINLAIHARPVCRFQRTLGSGKTTLLNLIGGLDQPSAGQVYLFGHDLASCRTPSARACAMIGWALSSSRLLSSPPIPPSKTSSCRCVSPAWPDANAREQVMRCLTIVGLQKWASHRPFEMSGGQQQRLSIAAPWRITRRLSSPMSRRANWTARPDANPAALPAAGEKEGVTILMSSHDPTVTEFVSDVYELSDGQIVSDHLPGRRGAGRRAGRPQMVADSSFSAFFASSAVIPTCGPDRRRGCRRRVAALAAPARPAPA